MKMNRKLCALFLCVLMLLTLVGCGESSSQNNDGWTVIRFWNGFTGKDGETMDEIVAQFNEEFAEQKIKVVADKLPWDTLFTKLLATSSNTKNAPHLVAMSASRISGMTEKGILQPMDGIEEYLGVTAEDYLDMAWDAGVLDGTRYGFPIDVHPTAMYYNKDIISEDELPETWEEFLAICKEKTKDGVCGWAVPSMYSIAKDVYLNMLYQNGGSVFDANNNPAYTSDAGIAALQYMTDLVYKEKVSPEDVGAGGDYTLFVQGRTAFYFDGPWVINQFGLLDEDCPYNIGVAPCPASTGENGTSFAGSHQFTMVKATVTDQKTKEACYTFMKYVSDNAYAWALAGQVPAKKSVLESEEYKALEPLRAFTEMAYRVDLGEIEFSNWYECYNGLGVAVSNAISGLMSPEEALNTAATEFLQWKAEEER